MKMKIGLHICFIYILIVFSSFGSILRIGKVTFYMWERNEKTGVMEINYYIMNADGSNKEKLVNWNIGEGDKSYQVQGPLSLSPDCKKAVFLINRESTRSIAVLNIENHKIDNITEKNKGILPLHPRWSPDGNQIIFSDISTDTIYIINSDGSNIKRICKGNNPDWSPDGRKIAFTNNDGIYTIQIDGNDEKKIAISPTQTLTRLRWSPDGKHILFSTCSNSGINNAYVVDSNGDDLRKIGEESCDVCWSPDGKKIAYVKQDSDKPWNEFHIWVMNPDGSDLERLTNNENGEYNIDWRDTKSSGINPSSNTLMNLWGRIKSDL